ncbi:HigA family addiction module antitoxin [Kocuria rhizophila]|uniref:HigA family addiction module antitoxin n=1 Tax=Kocuria rhizophila TaxID=72000 RepID=UPI0021A8160C|nr:HigA family addiction module antitoxin [Kocuria rhizophila]MCT1544944.1 HigA family addiction module antitoxin [Kocuria rhizophila]
MTTTDRIEPIHPGEVLMEDFIEGFGITQNKLAVSIGVPPRRINEIVHGKRGITADAALRLARYFGTSAEFWLNLQSLYELDCAEDLAGERIAAITPLVAA